MRMTVRGYFVALLLAALPALALTATLVWRYAEAQEESFE